MTPYVFIKFDISPEQLRRPFTVSTTVGESFLAEIVCHDDTIFVYPKDIMIDLVELRHDGFLCSSRYELTL